MINVHCRTNIDCCKRMKWPEKLQARPMVGDLIRSQTKGKKIEGIERVCEMEVIRCTWLPIKVYDSNNPFSSAHTTEYELEVELGIVRGRYASCVEFINFIERSF